VGSWKTLDLKKLRRKVIKANCEKMNVHDQKNVEKKEQRKRNATGWYTKNGWDNAAQVRRNLASERKDGDGSGCGGG